MKVKKIFVLTIVFIFVILLSTIIFAESAIIYDSKGNNKENILSSYDINNAIESNDKMFEETIKFNQDTVDFAMKTFQQYINVDSGLTISQVKNMSYEEGKLYFRQLYPTASYDNYYYQDSLIFKLWLKVLKDEHEFKIIEYWNTNNAIKDWWGIYGAPWESYVTCMLQAHKGNRHQYTLYPEPIIEEIKCYNFQEFHNAIAICDRKAHELGFFDMMKDEQGHIWPW